MDTLLEHPIYLIYILIPALLINNWWYIFFIYRDANNRNIKNKLWWCLLAYLIGPWLLPIYDAKTERKQTAISSSPIGEIAGANLEKFGKTGKIILAIISLVWLVTAVINLFRSYSNLSAFSVSPNALSFALFNLILPTILFLYSVLSINQRGKLNPLDRPLWGMKETPDGYLVDESLTKHKRVVKFLIWFIISLPVIAFLGSWIISKLGY